MKTQEQKIEELLDEIARLEDDNNWLRLALGTACLALLIVILGVIQ
jgi:hypothetical protein